MKYAILLVMLMLVIKAFSTVIGDHKARKRAQRKWEAFQEREKKRKDQKGN